MKNKDSYLVEAVSGKWLRLPIGFHKASCVVDLPNGIALNVSKTSGKIEIYAQAEDQIYYFSGEMVLETDWQCPERTAKITYNHQSKLLSG